MSTELISSRGPRWFKGCGRHKVAEAIKIARRAGYRTYTGPGGPTEAQVHKNNNALCIALRSIGVPAKLGKTKGPGRCYCEPVEIVRVGRRAVGYDRWGFVSEGSDKLDQTALRYTIFYLVR